MARYWTRSRRVFAGIGGVEEQSVDPCDGRRRRHSAMEPARNTPFHGRRGYWRYRRSRRLLHVHAEVKAAATAVIPVAGQGHERFLVAEQLTQEIGHLRLPDEASHCSGQPGSGERPSPRQQSWFCDEPVAQPCGCERSAAPRPSVPGCVSDGDWIGYRSAREVRERDARCSRMTQVPRSRSARVSRGYFGDPRRACTCAPGAIGRYQ